ncbi:hypothetical protein AJ80_02760 [Polytolypa hystricis UAMH7299]|uniref:Uncharacterized protein n=1 Tax=Polytolypa hystricis (strain UAMH7299) TaxID=1447883 RepID=A0A2B7YPL2_POLH7|nr:hypothetical protein AJ80_02760 [Polytolypa hystricis UAMH7299]
MEGYQQLLSLFNGHYSDLVEEYRQGKNLANEGDESIAYLRTKCKLELWVYKNGCKIQIMGSIHNPSTTANPKYYYSIAPCESPFLAYDPNIYDGNPNVDDDKLKSLYPDLSPVCWPWAEAYSEAFERWEEKPWEEKQCSKFGVFPDARSQIAFDICGMIISCWLALQPDVGHVRYQSGVYTEDDYVLRGDNVDTVFKEFLDDAWKLL